MVLISRRALRIVAGELNALRAAEYLLIIATLMWCAGLLISPTGAVDTRAGDSSNGTDFYDIVTFGRRAYIEVAGLVLAVGGYVGVRARLTWLRSLSGTLMLPFWAFLTAGLYEALHHHITAGWDLYLFFTLLSFSLSAYHLEEFFERLMPMVRGLRRDDAERGKSDDGPA